MHTPDKSTPANARPAPSGVAPTAEQQDAVLAADPALVERVVAVLHAAYQRQDGLLTYDDVAHQCSLEG